MRKKHLLPLSLYALLTVLMTWPTAARLNTAIPGDGFDGWQNYWNQWWIKEALLNQQTHFFFTDMLYPPTGVSLLFHTLNFFNGLWSLPLQLIFGPTVAYNAVVLFHFTLTGYVVYLLALWLLRQVFSGPFTAGHYVAAFSAGVIFSYSPFRMAHLLGHMQVFSLTWVPFYVFWLMKTLQSWRASLNQAAPPTDFARHLGLTGLSLALVTMIDWYHTLYLFLFTGLVLLWLSGHSWHTKRVSLGKLLQPWLGLGAMGAVFALLFSPLMGPMMREASTADYMRPSFQENITLSADLLAFFLPNELHPLWGQAVHPIYQNFTTTTSERVVFAGFVALALGLSGLWLYRRRAWVQFWGLSLGVFFLLALGPYLHINGQITVIGDRPILLPYLFLYETVPFIGISRSLSRYDLMVMLSLGLLAALTMARLRPRWQVPLIALICFEFWVAPYPMSVVDTPAYFEQLSQDEGRYAIAALPMNWDRPHPLLYQTVHQKDLLTAYTSRNNPLDLSWRTPVFQQWRTLNEDIIQADLAKVAPTIFDDFNLRYIVLDYYQMPPGPERNGTERWVQAALPNATPIHQDERLTVYQAPPLTAGERQAYLQLGETWGALNLGEAGPSRTIEETASLRVVGLTQAATLTLRYHPDPLWGLPPSLRVGFGGASETFPLAPSGGEISLSLPPGTETILLETAGRLPISGVGLLFDR